MALITEIIEKKREFEDLRHALHANPGLGFEEDFAVDMVKKKLTEFGFDEIHTGIGKTGIVGVLKGNRPSDKTIGLRADMDALPITEETGKPYSSKVKGLMHACGHDGHTVSLLAAAWQLSRTRDFAGTVYFIFQPAEEGLGGALAMIEDGLFERFPCERVYAYHNAPTFKTGHIYTRVGKIMSGATFFDVRIQGRGGHAGLPQTTIDTTQINANIVMAAQSIVARNVPPIEAGILSFTDVYAGTNSYNVIPDKSALKGCIRFFEKEVGELIRQRFKELVENTAKAYGASAEIDYREVFIPLDNDEKATEIAVKAAEKTIGADKVEGDTLPISGSEDFAFMTDVLPGNYVFIGGGEDAAMAHNPAYDFNDEILPIAASYFCNLVQIELG